MSGYLSTIYDDVARPYTDYPTKLCNYLFKLYEMKVGMTMLEPGCGRCEFLSGFKSLGLDVYGIDSSEQAKDYATDITVQICNVENDPLPFPDNCFDILYSKSFIEHLRDPALYLAEARRVLKPGGMILTLVPDWESNYKIYFDDFTHRSPFTQVSLRDAYLINGFMDVNCYRFRQLPIVWKYPLLNVLCSIISPFIPVRTTIKFLRWSRELMIIGKGVKPTLEP